MRLRLVQAKTRGESRRAACQAVVSVPDARIPDGVGGLFVGRGIRVALLLPVRASRLARHRAWVRPRHLSAPHDRATEARAIAGLFPDPLQRAGQARLSAVRVRRGCFRAGLLNPRHGLHKGSFSAFPSASLAEI